ncbi:MAG: hypothetical protein LUH45_06545 [Clostridiales bacterium]|nr:hypothetical protein [Clostridiales bacterium]MCD7856846.1 hypothetical protein [Clostridiales bacterium]
MRELTLQNGETVALTLNFRYQNDLRAKRPEVAAGPWNAMKVAMGGGKEDMIWPSIQTIYAAYLCGAIKAGTLEEAYSYDDFLEQLPEDPAVIITLANELLSPNQAGGSVARSRGRRASGGKA